MHCTTHADSVSILECNHSHLEHILVGALVTTYEAELYQYDATLITQAAALRFCAKMWLLACYCATATDSKPLSIRKLGVRPWGLNAAHGI